jgi:GT2 family glycosyltransferase
MSKARYACLLNSDTLLLDNAFKSMINFMDIHLDAAACGPKLLNPDMTVQSCIRKFPRLSTMILQGLNWHKLFPNGHVGRKYYCSDFDYSKESIVESIGTTAFIVRRETWETAGTLDERFPHYQVDLAYNLMLKRKNYKVYYTPCAEVIHYGSQSVNQMPKKNIIELHRALIKFSDYYDYFGSSILVKWLVRWLLRIRCQIKLLEFYVAKDKRVIKGPGSPRFNKPAGIIHVAGTQPVYPPREN